MMYRTSILFVLLMLTTSGSLAIAQAPPDAYWRVQDTMTNTGTYFYYYINPGSATIRVQVLGAFRTPGLYEIGDDTELSRLVALAGGPTTVSQVKDTRTNYSLKVLRPSSTGQNLVYESPFEEYVASTSSHPRLFDGDVLLMEVTQRQRFSWRDITSAVGTIGVLALAFDRLTN